jgi:hypothetical protein
MTTARVLAFLVAALFAPGLARGQAPPSAAMPLKDAILGAWHLVSVVSEAADGARGEPFGPAPKGIIVFTEGGQFSLFQSAADLPRLAANDRTRATAEEATTVVRNSIAYFGSYTVDEAKRELAVRLEGSTYANLLGGPPQRRVVTSLTATELAFDNPRTPSGMTLRTLWRKAP